MSAKLYESRYGNQSCFIMENEMLKVSILPQFGGKLQSIFSKTRQKEYLYQSGRSELIEPIYDMCFGDGDISGFDEMFPAINAGCYPMEPWKGIRVPDHGEVWSLPWDFKAGKDSLRMKVQGVRFPYTLEKKVELKGPDTIHLEYKAINHSCFEFPFIWAAHPLFCCNENMEIMLPPSVKQVVNAEQGKRLGPFAAIHSWPVTTTPCGDRYDISKISPRDCMFFEKYYAYGKVSEGWCQLLDRKTGEVIRLAYPVEKIPYLGIWVNEGGYANQYNIALEPCTGMLDSLENAVQWDQVVALAPRSEYEWYMDLSFFEAERVND